MESGGEFRHLVKKFGWGLLWVETDLSRTELRSRLCDFLWPHKIPKSAKGEPVSESQLCRQSVTVMAGGLQDEEGWSQPGAQVLSSCSMAASSGVDQCLWKVQLLQRRAFDQAGRKVSGGDHDERIFIWQWREHTEIIPAMTGWAGSVQGHKVDQLSTGAEAQGLEGEREPGDDWDHEAATSLHSQPPDAD